MRAAYYVAILVTANMCNFSRRLWMEANSPPEARGKQVAHNEWQGACSDLAALWNGQMQGPRVSSPNQKGTSSNVTF